MNLGAQGLEWGETPFWIDPVALLGLILVGVNFMTPISKVKGPLYVTLWYFMAMFVWTPLTVAMGNAVDNPEVLLQPYRLIELMPLLADTASRSAPGAVRTASRTVWRLTP